jgi:uncharacterized protein YndB with AHSA1/START domain
MKNEQEQGHPRSLTDGETIVATADLAMTPERAFRAFTTADLERWWGEPALYRMTEWKADVRPGGRWSVRIAFTGGPSVTAMGEFLEVAPPHKLVMTRQYTWDHPTLGQRVTKVTHLFRETPNGTHATVRHEGFEGVPAAADEHAAGWARVLRYLQADAAGATDVGAGEVGLGENSALIVAPAERERVRAFYRDVLGCPMTKSNDTVDVFRIGAGFYLATVYGAATHRGAPLDTAEAARALWLELRAEDPRALRARCLDFGVREIATFDKEHFYCQAPGGQVFRIVGDDEDLSAWQR